MPGVPAVPKPPGPDCQAASSKDARFQPSVGVVNVYRQVWLASSEVGTIVGKVGAGYWKRFASAIARRVALGHPVVGHQPVDSISTSVIWV